jgi:2-hydroxychromene-2-carboxylate isomerase
MAAPVFYYDTNSPYAYLAASRIDDVVPGAEWRPIAFGIVLRETGRVPWSLQDGRERDLEEIDHRAAARGLPPVRYPEGWPAESYSLAPLRAQLYAEHHGALKPFTRALFRLVFAEGRVGGHEDTLRAAARAASLDPAGVLGANEDPVYKERLREATEAALAVGVVGVPTVAVGDTLFWGDDQLEAAAAAAAA